MDGLGGFWTAFQAARDVGKDDGGGGGGMYPESQGHEFEPDSGAWPGGVDGSNFCKHCGVVSGMHGGGGQQPQPGSGQGGQPRPGGAWGGGRGFGR